MNWQPIETAPKDGTEIIGMTFIDHGDGIITKYGPMTMKNWGNGWESSWNDTQVIEYVSDMTGITYRQIEIDPTHWMPMPKIS